MAILLAFVRMALIEVAQDDQFQWNRSPCARSASLRIITKVLSNARRKKAKDCSTRGRGLMLPRRQRRSDHTSEIR